VCQGHERSACSWSGRDARDTLARVSSPSSVRTCCVRSSKKESEIDATEWLKQVLENFQRELADSCSDLYARGFVKADGNTNQLPLKLKEPSITEAITILKKKGMFPDNDSDDDDMVLGGDDSPSADAEGEVAAEAATESPAVFVPKADLTPGRLENPKKVVKEGGKRGVEIEGAADMSGLQFF